MDCCILNAQTLTWSTAQHCNLNSKCQNKAADERLNRRRGKVGTPDLASSRICQMKGGGSGGWVFARTCLAKHIKRSPAHNIHNIHTLLTTQYTRHNIHNTYSIHSLAHNIHNIHTLLTTVNSSQPQHIKIFTQYTHTVFILQGACIHTIM